MLVWEPFALICARLPGSDFERSLPFCSPDVARSSRRRIAIGDHASIRGAPDPARPALHVLRGAPDHILDRASLTEDRLEFGGDAPEAYPASKPVAYITAMPAMKPPTA